MGPKARHFHRLYDFFPKITPNTLPKRPPNPLRISLFRARLHSPQGVAMESPGALIRWRVCERRRARQFFPRGFWLMSRCRQCRSGILRGIVGLGLIAAPGSDKK